MISYVSFSTYAPGNADILVGSHILLGFPNNYVSPIPISAAMYQTHYHRRESGTSNHSPLRRIDS